MKFKSLLILAFIVFIGNSYGQSTLWHDTFSSNPKSWAIQNNEKVTLDVNNNKYYFEHKRTSGGWSTTKIIDLDTSRDFIIEAKILKISGIQSNGFGFVYGRKDSDNQFVFTINANGSYSIDQYDKGKFTALKKWTKSTHINKGNYAYNTLKIVREGKWIKFYVNDRYLTLFYYKPFFGKRIGFVAYQKQKIAIDDFKVSYAKGKAVVQNSKKTVWYDDFSSNPNGWAIDNTEKAELAVRSNKYYFEHKRTSGGWSTSKVINVDTNRDFKIEAKILKISGIQNNGFGFVYGRKDSDNQFVFTINSNGSYAIDKYENGKFTALKNWTKSDHIKKGNYAYNTLKIVKEGKWIKFYVNGRYLTLFYYAPFYGKRIGFVVYEKQKVAIDDFTVAYLKDDNINIDVDDFVTTDGKSIFNDNFTNNNNDWPLSDNANAKFEIKSNKYYFEHKRDKRGWTVSKTIAINTSKDFKIETKILKISGIQNNGFGLTFGRKDSDNEFTFNISSDGHYRFLKDVNGTTTTVKAWTKSSAINKGNYATNTLKVVKEKGMFKFYVNHTFLWSTPFEAFMGNRVGYVIYQKQKIAIHNLSISYVNEAVVVDDKKDDIFVTGTKVLEEYFNSNSNDWTVGNSSDRNLSVSNSYYNFAHNRTTGGWAVNIPKKIDSNRDFEITTKIKKVSGVTNYAYGLQWGKEDKSSFRYYITSSGYYKISRVVNGKEEIIKKYTTSSYIKKGNGAFNTLKIKKIGNTYKFYVNSRYLTQTNFEPFFGNEIGYVVYNKQKIAIDYLVINYTKADINNIVTEVNLKAPVTENFTSNSNAWGLSNTSDKHTRINNGKLYIKNNSVKSGAFISKKIEVNTSKDFIIETSITRLNNSNGSLAFTFGRKNNTNEFDLYLSKNGSYLFRKLENDASTKHIDWTYTNALNTEANVANEIKIVKSGNLLRFYFNDQYVNEAPFSSFAGHYMGFSVYDKQEVSIDYLKITYPSTEFNTPPVVVITEPVVDRGFKIVKTKRILVKGTATDKDGIYEIIVNGIEASIKENGDFSVFVPLKIGSNDLIVKATDLKMASSTKTFTVKRKSPVIVDDVVVINDKDKKKDLDIGFGTYYALLIGVSDYGDGDIVDLGDLPTKDAKDLANVLINKYSFKKENVIILNNSPKENDIIKEFIKLKNKVTNKDNVLVFYAGHGVYDETTQVGHWLPSDADMEYELNLISNSQVVDFLKGIQSKHTLLISDACFSGSIFKTRSFEKAPKSIQKKYELTSRKAITSGTLKTVPNKSVFLKYLLKRLENNTNPYLSARKLFDRIEEPVMNNSPNVPQYGTIYGIGDEGGDFIFIKKTGN